MVNALPCLYYHETSQDDALCSLLCMTSFHWLVAFFLLLEFHNCITIKTKLACQVALIFQVVSRISVRCHISQDSVMWCCGYVGMYHLGMLSVRQLFSLSEGVSFLEHILDLFILLLLDALFIGSLMFKTCMINKSSNPLYSRKVTHLLRCLA